MSIHPIRILPIRNYFAPDVFWFPLFFSPFLFLFLFSWEIVFIFFNILLTHREETLSVSVSVLVSVLELVRSL